jgi:hypothetical protein
MWTSKTPVYCLDVSKIYSSSQVGLLGGPVPLSYSKLTEIIKVLRGP